MIAEIKRRSPSAGLLRPEYERDFDPAAIARQYHEAGAAAISCLTDERFFSGSLDYIHAVRDAVPLPVLRKDFIIDPWQVWESRAFGADAILLIAECLTEGALIDLMILSRQLQLTCLVEVHSVESLLKVRPHVGFPLRSYMLLGINNRDLTTMRVDLNHTLRLVDMVEDRSILVSESGIKTPDDLARLRQSGVRIALIGESLMKQENPGQALRTLLGASA
ncbi:MAG: indole-3-glycerol-phosphate synthase [Planctomycetota bacterium]|nr:MAG: indole-3-glycerol-phosphate synthase [Planctomycetota bacterium]